MPDFNDAASEHEDQDREDALAAQRLRGQSAPKIAASGTCHNPKCGDEFPAGDQRLFCDSRCAAEHARHQRK